MSMRVPFQELEVFALGAHSSRLAGQGKIVDIELLFFSSLLLVILISYKQCDLCKYLNENCKWSKKLDKILISALR